MARPPMYLLAGPEELLLRRAADRLLAELAAEGEIEVDDLRASDLRSDPGAGETAGAALPDLRTGSLFGARRVVVIRQAQDLDRGLQDALVGELTGTPPDGLVILLASGTQRIQKLARRIGELGGRIDVAPPPVFDERKWQLLVADELRRHGRSADRDAVTALLSHAGFDVSAIAEKVAQVAATAAPGRIGAEQVEDVVVGHGSRGSFAVADAMCKRRPAEALTLLRGSFEAGDDPLLVLGALTYRIRTLVAVAGTGRDRSLALADTGLRISPGQQRHLEADRRNFGPGELTAAYRALAEADLEIKGGELPPQLAVERAVLRIATPAA